MIHSMLNAGTLTFKEFAMREPLPLATIHDAVLQFLRGRDDAVVFGAQAVNAYVDEPRMSQDIDLVSTRATELAEELAAENPKGLTFSVKLKDGKTQFHVGEKIRLELSFASSLPETYVFDNAGYDRSGRLDIDKFVVDRPDGVTDPLYDYYHKSLGGFMGGGLRGIGALTTKPQIVDYDLNEWLRFDKPGAYRLYVISHRLSKGKPYHQGNSPIEPASNVIQFEVVPADREW